MSIRPFRDIKKKTKVVTVEKMVQQSISVQSMTNTITKDTNTINQINKIESEGAIRQSIMSR